MVNGEHAKPAETVWGFSTQQGDRKKHGPEIERGGWKSNPLLLVVVLISQKRYRSAYGSSEAEATESPNA
jgi:hypothetical protein